MVLAKTRVFGMTSSQTPVALFNLQTNGEGRQ
jgi:hypothetical protein